MPTNSLLSWNETLTAPPAVSDAISRATGPILDWNGGMDSQFGKTGVLLPNNFVTTGENTPVSKPMNAGAVILAGMALYYLLKGFK